MKIAIVTGGGDCPGLNTVIRATVKAGTYSGWECVGIHGSFDGLLDPVDIRPLEYKAMDALLFRGGTILRSARCKPRRLFLRACGQAVSKQASRRRRRATG